MIESRVFEAKALFEVPMEMINEAKYAKFFWWDDLKNLIPVADSKSIDLK